MNAYYPPTRQQCTPRRHAPQQVHSETSSFARLSPRYHGSKNSNKIIHLYLCHLDYLEIFFNEQEPKPYRSSFQVSLTVHH